MSVIVVDASVAAKWFIEEEYGDAALSVLSDDHQLHAPDFLLLEMDSIICKWIRRRAVSPAEGSEVRDALRRFPLQRHPFVAVMDPAFEIAHQTGQSVYDCLYVALATLLRGHMVTADRKLYEAMKTETFKRHVIWIGNLS